MIAWVQPRGPQRPDPGTTLHVVLEQNIDGVPLHFIGRGEVFEGGRVLLWLPGGTTAGRLATEMLREGLVDAWFWGRAPTIRLRG